MPIHSISQPMHKSNISILIGNVRIILSAIHFHEAHVLEDFSVLCDDVVDWSNSPGSIGFRQLVVRPT